MGQGDFYPVFRGCLYEKWDKIKDEKGRFLSHTHGQKRDNFWQHNITKLILKNGAYKCKQRMQKLVYNCIKYIDIKSFTCND